MLRLLKRVPEIILYFRDLLQVVGDLESLHIWSTRQVSHPACVLRDAQRIHVG